MKHSKMSTKNSLNKSFIWNTLINNFCFIIHCNSNKDLTEILSIPEKVGLLIRSE
jgi:hypothetical protein